jgi:ABC-type bacteriocin/lantibiotic exporter with double-glycine peptidase domain
MNIRKKKIAAACGMVSIFLLGAFLVGIAYVVRSPECAKRFFAWQMHAEYLGVEGVVLQNRHNDCGPAALKMVLDHFAIRIPLVELERDIGLTEKGSSMLALKEMAELKGLQAAGWRFRLEDFVRSSFPAILFVNGDHYVVADSVSADGSVFLRDPGLGRLKMHKNALPGIWRGETLVICRK